MGRPVEQSLLEESCHAGITLQSALARLGGLKSRICLETDQLPGNRALCELGQTQAMLNQAAQKVRRPPDVERSIMATLQQIDIALVPHFCATFDR